MRIGQPGHALAALVMLAVFTADAAAMQAAMPLWPRELPGDATAGREVAGRVVSAAGQPIADAVVWTSDVAITSVGICPEYSLAPGDDDILIRTQRTRVKGTITVCSGADGRFALTGCAVRATD